MESTLPAGQLQNTGQWKVFCPRICVINQPTMTTTFPPRSSARQARHSKPPGETEFTALFHLFTQPAILLDNNRELVVQVNTALLQITTFASTELIGHPLRELLTGLPAHPLAADELTGVSLERRSRTALPVDIRVRALDNNGQWLVLFIEPHENPVRNLALRIDAVIQTMLDLNRFIDGESPHLRLKRSAEIIQSFLDCALVGIYWIEEGQPGFWKAAEVGELGLLSELVPANEVLRLSQTFVWRPGRRVQTDLHRSARMNNLSFVVSTPIAQKGLLVIADRDHEPAEDLAKITEALARQIGIVQEYHRQLSDYWNLSLKNLRDLSIWRSVAENSQEGILLLDPNLAVDQMNPAAEWMLGYVDWEVKGQPVENILIGPEQLVPALEGAVQGIPTHTMGNISLHRRNGQSFPVHMEIIPIQREGVTLAILIFFRDISERVEISNRTQQLEQRAVLGEVTAVFAHEVRNPINNISTGLQLLSVKLPENDPNQDSINRLIVDCQRLNHLMESVLNFSRHTEHKFEAVDLELLLRRLLDRWRPRMTKVNVTPFFQVEPNTPKVFGDPRSLDQVFTNLISNAVEAMSSNGGTLAVRITPFRIGQGRQQVEVTVSDNGPGIPDEVRDRIFEPFVTTKSQGTGLGLAITKRIVTAHRGSITVNTFPGGTVFHVLLLSNQGETE
jgi:two-component system, NtrC family, sensor histidine kinase AtoS